MITGHNHTSTTWTVEDQAASELEIYCPQCGEDTEALYEGYCEECCNQNNSELHAHNAEFDRWENLSNSQRESEIKNKMR